MFNNNNIDIKSIFALSGLHALQFSGAQRLRNVMARRAPEGGSGHKLFIIRVNLVRPEEYRWPKGLGTPLRDVVTEGVTTKTKIYSSLSDKNKPIRLNTAKSEQKRTKVGQIDPSIASKKI